MLDSHLRLTADPTAAALGRGIDRRGMQLGRQLDGTKAGVMGGKEGVERGKERVESGKDGVVGGKEGVEEERERRERSRGR